MKHNSILKSRLALELLLGIAGALLLSAGLLFVLRELLYQAADANMPSQESMNRSVLTRLQSYVDDQKLGSADLKKLTAWRQKERYAEVLLFCDGQLLFDSSDPNGLAEQADDAYVYSLYQETPYQLRLNDDKAADAFIFSFESARYYSIADACALTVSFFLFLLLLLLLVHPKLRYISILREELKLLEGGDLSYAMTVRGTDELAELARGIDAMRISILARQAGEAAAQQANRELIRALSHDLRTPLTSLIGYLELINRGQYEDPAQLEHFLKSSQEKAERIRELSDKLFSYFLVYAADDQPPKMEHADAYEFLHQVLCEHAFELESAGFTVETDLPELSADLTIEVDLILRVFENLFSNIVKYGDTNKPVILGYRTDGEILHLSISNGTAKNKNRRARTNLGLRTCETILERHGGAFFVNDDERFSVELTLPITLR